MSRALFELTSRGTGPGQGDERFTFCEQTAPAEGQLPLLDSITHKAGVVTQGAIIFSDEWRIVLRDEGTEGQGTYLGRLLARLPHWRGRDARIRWEDAGQWIDLVVYAVQRERGTVTFTLTTPIREVLDRRLSEFDRPAFLSSAVTATSNTFPLTGPVDAGTHIMIDDEIIRTIPQAATSTIRVSPGDPGDPSPRGIVGTTAAAHAQGARVHRVLHYRGDAARVLERILAEELGLRSRMDTESFREAAAWFRPVILEKYFTESQTVAEVLREVLELSTGALVYDEFAGRIRLISQGVWQRTGADTPVLDEDNLIGGGADWSSAEEPQEQVTRCEVTYGTGEPLSSAENPSVIHVDAEAESDQEYGRAVPREIDASEWLNNSEQTLARNSAEIIAERIVRLFRDPPRRIIGLELFGADGRAIRAGDVVRVRLPEFSQSEAGESQTVEALVQSAQRHILANRTTLRLTEYGRYEADFGPDEIIITNRRFNLSLEELFGYRQAAFNGRVRVVGAQAAVFGTRELIPSFKTGNLPPGTNITIRAEQGAKIAGRSGPAGQQSRDPGNGGDVIHVTSGNITLERDDHPDSCIAPGGGGGPAGGWGADGTVNAGGAPGAGGHGQGWSAALGLFIGTDTANPPGGISSRQRMFGHDGTDGAGPTGGDGGLRGALSSEATDGGDSGNAEDGGGGGGGAEGGEFGMPGETAGSGGDSGSVAGGQPSDPGAGGKLGRVTGGELSYDDDDMCIIGDVIGPETLPPLTPPLVTVSANRYQAVWTNEPVIGIAPEIVIEEIGADDQTEVLRSANGAGTLTNTSTETKNYRARREFTPRTPSAYVFFTLLPQTSDTIPDPVVTLSADGRTATFSVPVTPAGNVNYVLQRLNPDNGEYEGVRSYRESALTWTLTADGQDDQSYRIQGITIGPPMRTSSAWVSFTLKAQFFGTFSASRNNIVLPRAGTGTVDLTVSQAPTSNASVTVTVADTAKATVDVVTYAITPANWRNGKTLTFTGVAAGTTTFTATITGSEYDGQSVSGTISVGAGTALINGPSQDIDPGVDTTLVFSLGAQPTGDVRLTVTTDEEDITFLTGGDSATGTIPLANWNSQGLSVLVRLDADTDADSVSFTVTGSSGGYNGVSRTFTLPVANPFEIIAPDSVEVTQNAQFSVNLDFKLSAQPSSDVKVLVSCISPRTVGNASAFFEIDAEFTGGNQTDHFDSRIYDFTTSNWNTNQRAYIYRRGERSQILREGKVLIQVIGMPRIYKIVTVNDD